MRRSPLSPCLSLLSSARPSSGTAFPPAPKLQLKRPPQHKPPPNSSPCPARLPPLSTSSSSPSSRGLRPRQQRPLLHDASAPDVRPIPVGPNGRASSPSIWIAAVAKNGEEVVTEHQIKSSQILGHIAHSGAPTPPPSPASPSRAASTPSRPSTTDRTGTSSRSSGKPRTPPTKSPRNIYPDRANPWVPHVPAVGDMGSTTPRAMVFLSAVRYPLNAPFLAWVLLSRISRHGFPPPCLFVFLSAVRYPLSAVFTPPSAPPPDPPPPPAAPADNWPTPRRRQHQRAPPHRSADRAG